MTLCRLRCATVLLMLINCSVAFPRSPQLDTGAQSVGSTIVQVNDAPTSPTSATVIPDETAAPVLNQLVGEMTCEQMLQRLREIGLPVVLDQSARDDSLTEDDLIRFTTVNMPLYESLETVLAEHNATLAMLGSQLKIVSRDVAYSPEFFTVISYDVTHWGNGYWELEDLLKGAVAPDDWDDTNGDGTLSFSRVGGRTLMTIGQSYGSHRAIRECMAGLSRLQGSSQLAQSANVPSNSPSQTIEILSERRGGQFGIRSRQGSQYDRFDRSGFGGGGVGGYGLGGGVF